MPLSLGGWSCSPLGKLGCADSIKMIEERHPEVSTTMLRAVDEQHASTSFMGVVSSVQTLEEAGFVHLATGAIEVPDIFDTDDPNQPRKGWQATAARAVELRSQEELLASVLFTISPTDQTCRFDAQFFPHP